MFTYTYNDGTEVRARTLLGLARKVEHTSKAEVPMDSYNQGSSDPKDVRRFYSALPCRDGGWDIETFLGCWSGSDFKSGRIPEQQGWILGAEE